MTGFQDALKNLINKHCIENRSNTPDFILTDYLVLCLKAFEEACAKREAWYGHYEKPEKTIPAPAEEKWEPKVGEKCLWGDCDLTPFVILAIHDTMVWLEWNKGDYHTARWGELRPLPPEPPVKHKEIVAVEKDGYTHYGRVHFTDSGRKVFKITGIDEEFRWDKVTITHLVPEPQ